jgi:exopolysaccharide biosynthesis operon protein EpsL
MSEEKDQGALNLRHREARILASSLAAMLVHAAAVATPQVTGQETRPVHRTDAGDQGGDRGALHRLLVRIRHGVPAPMPRPGNWALALAGLIGAGAIARRRMSFMKHRTLVVPPPTDAQRIAATPALADARRASGGRPRVERLSYCLAAGLLLWPAARAQAQDVQDAARAQDGAKVTPFVEETLTTDDNVFRISRDVDPATVIGSPSRADTYRTTSFGLSAELPVSLQRFVANLTFNSTRYQRFSALDSDGHELRGSWLWQAGRELNGELGLADTYSLASFAQLLTTTPDRLKVRQAFVNGTWMVTPRWRLRAAADRLQQRNSDPASFFNDVNIDGVEASLSRLSKAGNSVGLSTRVESAHFPTPEPLPTALCGNDYRQYVAGPTLDWTVSGVSHLSVRAAQVSRRYQQLPQRNFDGQTGRAELTWTPTGKVSLTLFAQRDISPFEYIRSSLVLLKGFGLRPALHMTPKIDVSADLEVFSRTYLGDAAQALGLTSQRDDRVRSMSALLSYHPIPRIAVQVSLLHETRSSNAAFGDYAANVAWINARLAF